MYRATGLDPGHKARCALSSRERDVLGLMAKGMTNREIAASLGRSILTIQNQVHHVLVKLAARNRVHAVVRAMELGLAQNE